MLRAESKKNCSKSRNTVEKDTNSQLRDVILNCER